MRILLMHDVFPTSEDAIPHGDVAGYRLWNLKPCKICGATVLKSNEEIHRAWHQGLMNND